MRRHFIPLLLPLLALLPLPASAMAGPPPTPYVISSIRPVQLLVTAIAGNHIESRVLLPPHIDAHHYAPRPSDLRQLQGARAAFWVGPALEGGFASVLRQRGDAVALVTRLKVPPADPHIWTSPTLVRAVVPAIVGELSRVMPERSATFAANAQQFMSDLSAIDVKYAKIFTSATFQRSLVLHNAYSPLIEHYGLPGIEALTGEGNHLAGTRTVAVLRQLLISGDISCVLQDVGEAETAGMRALLDGVQVKRVELDPMGTTVENHREGFLVFYQQLVAAFAACSVV